jgi:phenol 2-monooxygenase
MQFYLNGYQPGDPDILAAAPGAEQRSSGLPETVDVLIVGSGPAGMLLAAQLSTFPGISTRLVERRPAPLQVGQADGVACRTVEMFDAFGLSAKLVRESYWVNETVFWRPSPEDRSKIVRTGRIQDTEDGLSEFPHLIVNQARLLQYLQDYMEKSPTRLVPDYGMDFVDLKVEPEGMYPVLVTLKEVATGAETVVRAKYVVGCDGARSRVRDAIGATPRGDFANHAWGVVDMLAVTDFPDIRLKAAIQSADEGNILLIPREGGYLVRLYVDLGEIDPNNREAFRLSNTQEKVIETAQRVLRPYTLDVRDVAWFAVYQVGQRVTDRFDAAGAGYSTELMARAVAPGGKVYAQNDKASEKLAARMKTPAMANAVEVVLPFDNLSDPELHGPWLVCSKTKKQHDTMLFAAQAAQVLAAANMMLASVPTTGRTESSLAA